MYIRTPHALAWVEPTVELASTATTPPTPPHTHYQERWAKKPLDFAHGRFVAVRQCNGQIEVGCIVDKRLIWLAMNHPTVPEKQLQRWLRSGF